MPCRVLREADDGRDESRIFRAVSVGSLLSELASFRRGNLVLVALGFMLDDLPVPAAGSPSFKTANIDLLRS